MFFWPDKYYLQCLHYSHCTNTWHGKDKKLYSSKCFKQYCRQRTQLACVYLYRLNYFYKVVVKILYRLFLLMVFGTKQDITIFHLSTYKTLIENKLYYGKRSLDKSHRKYCHDSEKKCESGKLRDDFIIRCPSEWAWPTSEWKFVWK